MPRFLRIPLLAFLLLFPAASSATTFPCDEAGFDQAVAASKAGDPGPHGFACAPEDLPLVLTTGRVFDASLTIDGEGQLLIEGLHFVHDQFATDLSVLDLRNLALVDPQISSLLGGPLELRLSNAHVSGNGYLHARHLSLQESVVSDLHHLSATLIAAYGPASSPEVTPSLDIVASEISDSSGDNGIISVGSGGTISVVDSTVRDNTSPRSIVYGGAGASGTIMGTTFSGNAGSAAVFARSGMTIENTTISANTETPGPFSHLFAVGLIGCPTVRNSTISGNSDIEGHSYSDTLFLTYPPPWRMVSCSDPEFDGTPAVFENTILDGSCDLNDDLGPPTLPISHGGNIETGGDTCGFGDPTDQVAVAPAALALGPLADNGGPTETHALLPGSVAQDAAVLANCPATDQRGEPRPEPGGSACDAGSFEVLPEPELGVALAAGAALLPALDARRRRRARAPGSYTSGNG